MWNLKNYNKLVSITEKNQTYRCREQTSSHQWGEQGEGQNRSRRWGYKLLEGRQTATWGYSQYLIITVNGV